MSASDLVCRTNNYYTRDAVAHEMIIVHHQRVVLLKSSFVFQIE